MTDDDLSKIRRTQLERFDAPPWMIERARKILKASNA
jgi:hypothetical protein